MKPTRISLHPKNYFLFGIPGLDTRGLLLFKSYSGFTHLTLSDLRQLVAVLSQDVKFVSILKPTARRQKELSKL